MEIRKFAEEVKVVLEVMTGREVKIQRVFGAATMCYGDAIKNFARKMESDIIILPCSLHELILIPMKANADVEVLKNMVYEVNRTEVANEDVLSDSVYIYRRNSNHIDCVQTEGEAENA